MIPAHTFLSAYQGFHKTLWWPHALGWAIWLEWLFVWDFLRGETYEHRR